jgi:hypothetical protein
MSETSFHHLPEREQSAQLIVLGLAVALAAALVGWLLVRDHTTAKGAPAWSGVVLVSAPELQRLAGSGTEPVYWAGRRDGFSYELTRSASGRTYVRYLPQGVAAGDGRAGFLTVATYAVDNAYGKLRLVAAQPASKAVRLHDGGLAVFGARRPTSVYLAFPRSAYQVEVYAPAAAEARRVALSGAIKPIR